MRVPARQGYGAAWGPALAALAARVPRATARHRHAAAALLFVWLAPVALSATAATTTPYGPTFIAGAFVYPVGDELDHTKPHSGESAGFYVSDEYLAKRGRKKRVRTHYGVDLACGRGGAPVRSVGSGVVVVADANALVKVRKKQKLKVPVVVDGKTVNKTTTKMRTTYKWRTGWGNHVVIRHTLPSGETVFSLYAHLQPKSVLVKKGDVVTAGQPLGRVGRSGRASSSHLHFEVRKAVPAPRGDEAEENGEEDEKTPEERSFTHLGTVDPMAFLETYVRRFDDLEPGTWQQRYALAACRDGVVSGEGDEFDPDESITRVDYYRQLVAAFHLATPFTTTEWSSTVDALVDADILDASSRSQRANDRITRSDALELMLRSLDQHVAHARNLARMDAMQVCLDFNLQFAGPDSAKAAMARAEAAAAAETNARKKAEAVRVARAVKAAKAAGKTTRVKAKPVKPVKPVPLLDPGFESLAQSKKELTRAESCLLLATALRLGQERVSALQRAAVRVAAQG